jgi:Ser/Thr protein kinase RdoA (MazF antagonist)
MMVADLLALTPSWLLGSWHTIEKLPKGQNDSYRVATDSGDFVLRVSRPTKTRESLEVEIAALDAAGKAGLPTVRPAVTRTGEGWVMIGGRFATMTPFIAAEAYKGSSARRRAIGTALATCHIALRDLVPPASPPPARRFDLAFSEMAQRPGPCREAYAEAAHLESRITAIAPRTSARPPTLIHGSCRKSSLLFQGDRLAAFLDFDSIRLGDLAEDIAIVLLSFAQRDGQAMDLERVAEIADSYAGVRRLEPDEPQLVVYYLATIALFRVQRDLAGAEADATKSAAHLAQAARRLGTASSVLAHGPDIVRLLSQSARVR